MTGITMATPEQVPDAVHHISAGRCTSIRTRALPLNWQTFG